MTNPSFRRHFLLLAAMFCASTGVLSTVTAQDGPADLLYSQIKQVEAQMKALEGQTPLPPYTVVQVGTFDVQAGKFDGHGAKHEVDSPIDDSSGPGEPLKPPKNQPTISDPRDGKLSPFNLEIGTPRAQASFAFENNGTETCELSVNSAKNTVAAGAPSVTVDVGTHGNVDWTVACGNGKSYDNHLFINRPAIYAAGAFKVSAIPFAVLYEPPVDSQNQSYASYTATKNVGTSVHVSFTSEASLTTPTQPTDFARNSFDKSVTDGSGKALSAIQNPWAKAFGAILSLLSTGLGSATATLGTGNSISTDKGLLVSLTTQDELKTAAHLGPGRGDRIFFLQDAKIAWVWDGDAIHLQVIGYRSIASPTVELLKADWQAIVRSTTATGARTGLTRDTIESLLQLDPFAVHGPNAALPDGRFSYVEAYTPNGSADTHTITYTQTTTDSGTAAHYAVGAEDYSAGFLASIGGSDYSFGQAVTQTYSWRGKTTETHAQELTYSESEMPKVFLPMAADEYYTVVIYSDKVFGTFAFVRENATGQNDAPVSGTASNANGSPARNALVKLTIGGRLFTTRTDARGRYWIRSQNLPRGRGSIQVVTPGGTWPISKVSFRGAQLKLNHKAQ